MTPEQIVSGLRDLAANWHHSHDSWRKYLAGNDQIDEPPWVGLVTAAADEHERLHQCIDTLQALLESHDEVLGTAVAAAERAAVERGAKWNGNTLEWSNGQTYIEKSVVEALITAATTSAAEAARVEEREKLPEGMKHCTILFNSCDKGHGWLTATNWVQHGCPTCERDELLAKITAAEQAAVERERERCVELAARYLTGCGYHVLAADIKDFIRKGCHE